MRGDRSTPIGRAEGGREKRFALPTHVLLNTANRLVRCRSRENVKVFVTNVYMGSPSRARAVQGPTSVCAGATGLVLPDPRVLHCPVITCSRGRL